jgi:hypothetical protein
LYLQQNRQAAQQQLTSGEWQAKKDIAAQQNELQKYLGGLQYGTQKDVAGIQAAAQRYGSQEAAQAAMYGAAQQAGASRYATQLGTEAQQKVAQTQAEASKYPAQLQQERFGQIFPLISGAYNQLSSELAGGGTASAGGAPTAGQPQITVQAALPPEVLQQQINAQRAAIDAQTAGKIRETQAGLAGRGYGSGSPLGQALGVMASGQGMAAKAATEQQTRQQAAQDAATRLLAQQQAVEQQYATRQSEALQRAQIVAQRQNAIIAALTGLG